MKHPTFSEDIEFLQEHSDVVVLESADESGAIAVSPDFQGRVMTSAVGNDATSLGWINRDFVASPDKGGVFDNYGGEDRFWLGPEAGQYGLYFPPGSTFDFGDWHVPAAFNTGSWTIAERSAGHVMLTRAMSVSNYSGTRFDLSVERAIRIVPRSDVEAELNVSLPASVEFVAYESDNRVENTGDAMWTTGGGLVSIWILGMYETFGTTYVVVPFDGDDPDAVLNDSYFGELPPERLSARDGFVVFLCDGEYRSKFGINQAGAVSVMGSYSPEAGLLTLVSFSLPDGQRPYVNSLWEIQDEPYGGDVVNSYNDGSPGPGLPPLGGFYELETSSPGLKLGPGQSYTHNHRTIHIVGDRQPLDDISSSVLGISLGDIESRLDRSDM
jgi:hypothetical protein